MGVRCVALKESLSRDALLFLSVVKLTRARIGATTRSNQNRGLGMQCFCINAIVPTLLLKSSRRI